jgi:hypothetical protein
VNDAVRFMIMSHHTGLPVTRTDLAKYVLKDLAGATVHIHLGRKFKM